MTASQLDAWLSDHRGREFGGGGRTMTEADIVNFAGVTGDFAPIHIDERVAAATRYGSRIAHGLLVLSFATTLVSQARPFPALASYGYEGLRFTAPVRPGDTVVATGVVTDATSHGEDHTLVTLRYRVTLDDDTVAMVCDHLLLCSNHGLFTPE